MPNKTWALVKLQLINQLRLNDWTFEQDKAKRFQYRVVFVTLLLVGVVLMGYCFLVTQSLIQMGLGTLIPSYALTISSVIVFFLTLLKAQGVLFATKDYDLLMSLPIPTRMIVASRLLVMFCFNLIGTLLIMVPMGIGYSVYYKPQPSFYGIWFVGTLLVSLIPTTLAACIGAAITFVASRFRYTQFVTVGLSLVAVMGILGGSLFMQQYMPQAGSDTLGNLAVVLTEQIHSIYPIARLFAQAVGAYDLLALGWFICLSIGCYYIFIWVLGTQYKRINTSLVTHRTTHHFKRVALQVGSPLQALYKKELRRWVKSSPYLLNTVIGPLMALLLAVIAVYIGKDEIERILGMTALVELLAHVAPLMLAVLLTMGCTTCSALSLEGKNVWLIQSAPVSLKTVLLSKILVNITLLMPISIVASSLLVYVFKPQGMMLIAYFVIPLVYAIFTSVWGMFMNVKYPRFDWESETQVVKQSLAATISLLVGPLFAIVPTMVVCALPISLGQYVVFVTVLVMLLMTVILYKKLMAIKQLKI